MADINKLFTDLTKAQENILGVVDSLNALSKSALEFQGEISRVIPLNLKAAIDSLLEVAQGNGQSSIEKLMEFLDNVPISEIRRQTLVKKTLNGPGIEQVRNQANNAVAIDTVPNTSSGPQSAITRESTNRDPGPRDILKEFLKENYKKPSYEQLTENNELSFDAILNSDELGLDTGLDPFEDVPMPTSSFADQYNNGDYGLPGEDYGEFDPLNGDSGYTEFDDEPVNPASMAYPTLDDRLPSEIFPRQIDPSSSDNWRDVLRSVHPESRDIDEVLNDTREPV